MEYFKLSEFDCKETGENKMNVDFLNRLDLLRGVYDRPLVVSSGYRSPNHSVEKKKTKPGYHAKGVACDFKVTNSADRFRLLKAAYGLGFTGIASGHLFVHIDDRGILEGATPMSWVY